jgi:CRISPR/Cas system CSM-associated protein Csm3 (group 7 of RAMP superfamily)
MIRLNFTCEFKSDIVLHATSNTEGKIEKLDYIPGSNFLGMVARHYADFGADAFEVFHSGAVRFGDGHIMIDGEPTLPMAFSFYSYKGVSFETALKNSELFVHHHLTQEDYDKAIEKKTQLKQQRVGYFTPSGKIAKLEHSYKQKSAYDKHKRRSKKRQMFGYHALPAGTKWAFSVELDNDTYNDTYKDMIIEHLVGQKRLGKSKSAEYGLVEIEYKDKSNGVSSSDIQPQTIGDKKYLFIYAKSRLALTDKEDINSYVPSKESLGFKKEDNVKIDWEKSQIRTSRYTPYVGVRGNFDPERLVIDKGSVFAIETADDFDVEAFKQRVQKPIGLYVSEGLGEVIVNPKWLLDKQVKFTLQASGGSSSANTTVYDSDLNRWLTSQREAIKKESELLAEVNKFIDDKTNNVKNKKAQWGQIRSLCRQASNSDELYELLFSTTELNGHPKGFLRHGRGLEKWDKKLIDNLEQQKTKRGDDFKQFVTLLSIYAPKQDDKQGGDDE